MNLDDYIEGAFDTNAPFNQPDIEHNLIDSVSEALELEETDLALEMLSQLRKDVNLLREFCRQYEKPFLNKKLNEIYGKL